MFADRLAGAGMSAGGQPGQHPLHHHLSEHVLSGKVRVAIERNLMPVNGARSRPGHRNTPPAQGYRALLGAVAHRDPLRVVLVLRPGDLGHLGLKDRLHHRQPGGHAHRQKPLACRSSDIAHRQCDLLRQIWQHNGIGAVGDANSRYGLHQRSPSLWVFFGRITRDLPRGRAQVGDRHLKFHEDRDNLHTRASVDWRVHRACRPVQSRAGSGFIA